MSLVVQESFIDYQNHKIFVKTLSAPQPSRNFPTLVLLHEGLGCVELWRDFPEKLVTATKFPVLLFDRLGHGRSDAMLAKRSHDYLHIEAKAVLPHVLRQCHIDRPVLFGHSDGGTIALLYAAFFPDAVSAIITEAAHVFVEDETIAGICAAKKQFEKAGLREKLYKYHGDKVDALFSAWADTWTNPAFKSWDITEFLAQITCPTLILQGEQDNYGTEQQVNIIANEMNGLSVSALLPHRGHSPHAEAPDEVLVLSTNFLNTIDN